MAIIYVGTTTIEQPGVVIYHPGVTVELTCDISGGVGWVVNGASYFLDQLQDGSLPGHNVNGSNLLLMNNPGNYSQYVCANFTNSGGIYLIVVAGEYADLFVCMHMSHIHTLIYELVNIIIIMNFANAISCKSTFGVKKVWPSKVELCLEVST